MQKFTVGIREAKINLSKLIKRVQKGMDIILTDRGKPVAMLSPVNNNLLTLRERIQHLENNGWIEPSKGKTKKPPQPLPLPDNLAQKLLEEDRSR